ncbi:HNH endonuclease [Streptacidiphilus carbonis]|uniref:HNH endonuclease n=1 Tax=Streptacidiphilus carbonis TaxID=105422 RepID=UPI0007C67731|nr:HNH endonuclease [Streptacidiphilus carbonis]
MTINLCADCGGHPDKTGLRRGRCGACYQRHLKALKQAGDYTSLQPDRPLIDRLMEKVAAGWGGCHIWTGHVAKRTGYGVLSFGGGPVLVHRAAHELLIGPVPEGLHVDHTCHNRDASCAGGATCLHRRCLNVGHLEAVPPGTNLLRSRHTLAAVNAGKTRCPQDHAYDEANTVVGPEGARGCRECRRERDRARRRLARLHAGPQCGHFSADGKSCTRQAGHAGKHHAQPAQSPAELDALAGVR